MSIGCAQLSCRVCVCLALLDNITFFLKSFVTNFSFSSEVCFGRLIIFLSNKKGVSLINNEVDHLHLYLYSCFVFKTLCPHLVSFFIQVDCILIHRILKSLDSHPLSVISVPNSFSQLWLLYIFPFDMQNFSYFVQLKVSNSAFMVYTF